MQHLLEQESSGSKSPLGNPRALALIRELLMGPYADESSSATVRSERSERMLPTAEGSLFPGFVLPFLQVAATRLHAGSHG